MLSENGANVQQNVYLTISFYFYLQKNGEKKRVQIKHLGDFIAEISEEVM